MAKVVGGEDHRETQHQPQQRRIDKGAAHDARHVGAFGVFVGHMHPRGVERAAQLIEEYPDDAKRDCQRDRQVGLHPGLHGDRNGDTGGQRRVRRHVAARRGGHTKIDQLHTRADDHRGFHIAQQQADEYGDHHGLQQHGGEGIA